MSTPGTAALELLNSLVGRLEEAKREHEAARTRILESATRAELEASHRQSDGDSAARQRSADEHDRLDRARKHSASRIDAACRRVVKALDDEATSWLETRGALEYRLDRVVAVCRDLEGHGARASNLIPYRGDRRQRAPRSAGLASVRSLYDEIVRLYWSLIQTRRASGRPGATGDIPTTPGHRHREVNR